MRLLVGHSDEVAAWVAARIPQMRGEPFGPCAALGVVSEHDRPLAGVVFTNYHPWYRSIEVSFASESRRWLTRNLIRQILSYPFDQLDCQRVTAVTPRKATSARRFLDTFGFKREGLVRKGFGDDDAVISGLLKTEWLRSKWNLHGQAQSPQAARSDGHRQRPDGVERGDGPRAVHAQ